MPLQSTQEAFHSPYLQKAFGMMGKKKFEEAEKELLLGLDVAAAQKDSLLEAVFYSSFGVLYKLKNDFKMAWRYYEKAEKILPREPALKVISARLLVEIFGQYDTALKKVDQVLKLTQDPLLVHQAQAIAGLAELKKGNKKRAIDFLDRLLENNFEGMGSVLNLDFRFFEELLKKNIGLEACKTYLEKARQLAVQSREDAQIQKVDQMLESFAEYEASSKK